MMGGVTHAASLSSKRRTVYLVRLNIRLEYLFVSLVIISAFSRLKLLI